MILYERSTNPQSIQLYYISQHLENTIKFPNYTQNHAKSKHEAKQEVSVRYYTIEHWVDKYTGESKHKSR